MRCNGPQFTNDKPEPSGIIFGNARTMHNEGISVFVRGEQSQVVSALVDMFTGSMLLRFRLSELKKFRGAIDKAIEWLERDKCDECHALESDCTCHQCPRLDGRACEDCGKRA